jgi:hypothetical protein
VHTRQQWTSGLIQYRVKFFLRETSGAGTAWIQRIVVSSPAVTDDTGSWCWGDTPMLVPPSGTLDVNDETLGYCAPIVRAAEEPFQFELLVTFTDDEGKVESTVGASLTVTE